MNPTHRPMDIPPPSTVPVQGWHCSHFFYRWNRDRIASMSELDRRSARHEIRSLLDPSEVDRPQRFQRAAVVGHKADFALVMMDPDPLKINAVHQRLMQCRFGELLQPTYSFVSMSEISEYLPDKEQYAKLRENVEVLRSYRTPSGEKLTVVEFPFPEPRYCDGARWPAGYMNFYFANGLVLVPTYNDVQDRYALGLLADLLPNHKVIGIHCADWILGGGTLHCSTQQEPDWSVVR